MGKSMSRNWLALVLDILTMLSDFFTCDCGFFCGRCLVFDGDVWSRSQRPGLFLFVRPSTKIFGCARKEWL